MRVFVTGASGFIGRAVVPELVAAGHDVVGLARSDAAAATIAAGGAEVQRGELHDLDVLRAGADDSDAVIHLAYIHDFSQYDESVRVDRAAIASLGDALAGTGRPLLIASGVLGVGAVLTEDEAPDSDHPRVEAAAMALALADRDVRPVVVRFAPTVHGEGDHGFVATLIDVARTQGVSGYVADGTNRWAAVHRTDAAHLVRLALESASPRSVAHAVGEEGVPTRTIAEAIGRHLDVPVTSIAPDAAAAHFGWIGAFFGADAAASNVLTRERFDWTPTGPSLIEDLDQGHYFVGS